MPFVPIKGNLHATAFSDVLDIKCFQIRDSLVGPFLFQYDNSFLHKANMFGINLNCEPAYITKH